MIDGAVVATIGAAALSASARGAISVIDRFQFGIRLLKIRATNVHNNLLAVALSFLLTIAVGQVGELPRLLVDVRVIVFGLLLQVSASAFSYAFKHMKVPSIIIFTKASDLLLAPMIFLVYSQWITSDFIFAALTTVACLPVLVEGLRKREIHKAAAVFVCVSLLVQATLSPWMIAEVRARPELWVSFTCALVIWRFVFSVAVVPGSLLELPALARTLLQRASREYMWLLSLRAVLTLVAQGFQIQALSYGRPVLAWPVLNATGLFAIVLSAYILKERGGTRETFAILVITALGAAKVFT